MQVNCFQQRICSINYEYRDWFLQTEEQSRVGILCLIFKTKFLRSEPCEEIPFSKIKKEVTVLRKFQTAIAKDSKIGAGEVGFVENIATELKTLSEFTQNATFWKVDIQVSALANGITLSHKKWTVLSA